MSSYDRFAKMSIVFVFLAMVLTCALGQPPQCSEECTRFILDNAEGPQLLKLVGELSKPEDPDKPKVNRQYFTKSIKCLTSVRRGKFGDSEFTETTRYRAFWE